MQENEDEGQNGCTSLSVNQVQRSDVLVEASDSFVRASAHSSERSSGLLSGQNAPVLGAINSSDENAEDFNSDIDTDSPVRLTSDDEIGHTICIDGFDLREPLQALLIKPIYQPLNVDEADLSGSEDEGFEEAMDYFL